MATSKSGAPTTCDKTGCAVLTVTRSREPEKGESED